MDYKQANKHNVSSLAKAKSDCSLSQSPRKISYGKDTTEKEDKETNLSKLTRTSFNHDKSEPKEKSKSSFGADKGFKDKVAKHEKEEIKDGNKDEKKDREVLKQAKKK